ncbi:MAG: rhamnogalacturonan lyase [Paludibacter sp.]|nr:rhamnogalacturonan lyase [Paludibacter sp.]
MKKINTLLVILAFYTLCISSVHAEKRQMEYLNRGLVAVKVSNGVFLSWRMLGTDTKNITFNIYRNNRIRINQTPVATSTNFLDSIGTLSDTYTVKPVLNGKESNPENAVAVTPWEQQFKTIQLNRPEGDVTPEGMKYAYVANDCSVGDLDGDGEYEIVVKWNPTNAKDNSQSGYTGKVYLDAYKLNGKQLWRIDLGRNIRAGAHYTQFMVYDFDGDGIAEVVCKTAPGTKDGKGKQVIMEGDSINADYRSGIVKTNGKQIKGIILRGPEYLTLFNGKTGGELNTIAYNPPREASTTNPTPDQLNKGWGDGYGNREDRYLACVAYLDGVHPSVVMCRGYYTRTALAAYDVKDKKLVQRWFYDSGITPGVGAYGQGNHNLSVGDIDGDGKDEIVYGSCAIDDNGSLMYSTGLGHGDAMHLSDLDPDRPGLEVWEVHENHDAEYGYELHDAKTGEILWGEPTESDNGRGLAADIDPRHRGFEMWSASGRGTYSCKGVQISTHKPSINFRIYWDGDLQDELLDRTGIDKWTGDGTERIMTFTDALSINGTKSTPCLSADLLGDWREEVLLRCKNDSSKLLLYTTTIPTTHRLYTPMHDATYRLGVAWQNVAYNQPPYLGFYIGDGVDNIPQPEIMTPRYQAVILEGNESKVGKQKKK